jgi:release factor glutamine methyltransferase
VPRERFGVIVANPPYVAEDDPHLGQGDLRYEPPLALSPGGDGLDAVRAIVAAAPAYLAPGAALALEHGHDQAQAVQALLRDAGFEGVTSVRDLAGIQRVSYGRRAP